MRRPLRAGVLSAIALCALCFSPAGATAGEPRGPLLADGCFVVAVAANGTGISIAGPGSYRVRAGQRATRFHLKPTGLGSYMLADGGGRLLGVGRRAPARLGLESVGRAAEWRVPMRAAGTFELRRASDARRLVVKGDRLALSARRGTRFTLRRARGCRRFPEAQAGVKGSFRSERRGGAVAGFIDTHLHITADMRAGGRVIQGKAFDRFGITRALGRDARDHGPDGSKDVTGNLLREGVPFGTHSTEGWPSFSGWPVHDTVTHQQVYWTWLERAWRAGLRLVVAQAVEDDELCRIEPLKLNPCDEAEAVALQVRRLRGLERYVDAHHGGRGRGWLRLVYGPRQARRVIRDGKLAVVIGVESSNPFGCGLREGRPQCSRAELDRGVERFHRLGVRTMFMAHWFDNSLAGAALEGGVRGKFINAMNRLRTGSFFRAARCPQRGQGEEVEPLARFEITVVAQFFPAVRPLLDAAPPRYAPGRQCNARGLTRLGEHAVRRLIAKRMLIEVDHMSERARDRVLALAEAARYPLVSSHNGTGGSWTPSQLRRLHALGGLASVTSGTAPELIEKILGQRRFRGKGRHFGVGLGTDTGGFAELPGPRESARSRPLRYPFKSLDGRASFGRQRSGTRSFDLNADGVAHYGLMADLVADMRARRRGRAALRLLFDSAEAYLRMWRRSGARG